MITTENPPTDTISAGETQIDRALLVVAGVVVLGAIMSILDTTVVNVAINTLAAKFHTTLPTIQWVATGYTLALATVIPLSGWIADRFGTKRLYMVSIALVLGGSMLSGLAWSSGSIILFRVLQGLGGGMIMPAGMTILARAARPQRIGRVMSIMGVPMLLGPMLAGLVLIAGFVWHALRARDPLIDLRLFRDHTFSTSSLTLIPVAISVFGTFLLLPLYFQAVRGESPLQSGLLLAPQGLGSMIAMPIAGQLADRTGPGKIVPFGLITIVLAVLGLTQVGAHTAYWKLCRSERLSHRERREDGRVARPGRPPQPSTPLTGAAARTGASYRAPGNAVCT